MLAVRDGTRDRGGGYQPFPIMYSHPYVSVCLSVSCFHVCNVFEYLLTTKVIYINLVSNVSKQMHTVESYIVKLILYLNKTCIWKDTFMY